LRTTQGHNVEAVARALAQREVAVKSGNQLTARRSERIYVQMPVTLHVDSNAQSEEHDVSTVDLSTNGVRVRANAGLLPGLAIAIVTNSGQPCTFPGRVVWTGLVGTRLEGQAGVEFLKPVAPPV
jgi:hypothetical protein